MEEVIDFDKFISSYIPKAPEYEAIYNSDGVVISICPKGVSDHLPNKVPIDIEIVEQIHSGTLHLHNCFIDLESHEIEIIRQEYLKKIDDIFHRIPEKKYLEDTSTYDIEIIYKKQDKIITFCMSEKLKNKKIRWSGDTKLNFYITSYNDPHILIEKIDITIDELYQSNINVSLDIDQRFSIFTKRLLKNYVVDFQQ
jgi:hypothetical protein